MTTGPAPDVVKCGSVAEVLDLCAVVLERSDVLLALARKAHVRSLECHDENVEAWAEKLARDVSAMND